MPTFQKQLALRERLQHIEDELVKQSKRHVTSRTLRGTFEWSLPGAWQEPPEGYESGELPRPGGAHA